MSEPALLLEIDAPIARLTLNRPAQRNALSQQLLRDLLASITRLGSTPAVRVAIVAGRGAAFSAGHDLREIAVCSPETGEELFRLCSEVMLAIQRLAIPVIARVHGMATAAGCQLVAACDLAIAADTARFATPGVNIGLFCSTPAVPLVRSIGRKRALEMLLTGTPISAETAVAWGLVNRIVPESELDSVVDELARQIATRSPATIALGKRAFYEQLALSDEAAYAAASVAMAANAVSPDAREGISAFLERRSPRWRADG